MEFELNEEQIKIQDSLRRFLDKHYRFEHRRTYMASPLGYSETAWTAFAELGLLSLTLPAACSELHAGPVEIMLVMERLGASLALEPYLANVVLAGGVLRDLGTPAQLEALLAPMAEGRLKLALAHQEPGARFSRAAVTARAARTGEGWTLTAHKSVVFGAPDADHLIVSAMIGGSPPAADALALFVVDCKDSRVQLHSYSTQDGRRAADVWLHDVPVGDGALLGQAGQVSSTLDRVLDQGVAALCAEAVGTMAMLNDATLEYLKTRHQFGQPIGSFQVLQHRMVDMVIALEQSRAMAMLASVTAGSHNAATRNRAVSAAKAYIGEQARFIGQQAVQLHGGMGLSDELAISHAFKRLAVIDATLGDADHHLGRFSDGLLGV